METGTESIYATFGKYSYTPFGGHEVNFEFSPFRFDEEDQTAEGLMIEISWNDLDTIAQNLGLVKFNGESDVVDAATEIIHDQIPLLNHIGFVKSHVDEWGEQWVYTLPEYEKLTDGFIEIIV